MVQSKIKVSAPGKIILSGEHSVVYGYPALLGSTNLRLSLSIFKGERQKSSKLADYAFDKLLRLNNINNPESYSFRISSKIPVGSGMGSSAALAVSMAASINILSKKEWNLENINNLAYEIEKKQHGTPSGGDNTVVSFGGFVWYRKEAENLKVFSNIKPKRNFPQFFIINSGQPKESTKEMVQMVRKKYEKNPQKVEKIFKNMESCSRGFLKFILKEQNIDIGQLLVENQRLLEELGIVSNDTMDLVSQLEKNGANVKVSGAGGKVGGSGILLVYHKDSSKLETFAKSKNLDIISVKLGQMGVKKD
ncbi:mevalonate kinase [Patescibacteria group bacterium]